FPFPAGAIARIQTHNANFVDFAFMNTDIPQLYVTALSEHTPAAAEALLLTGPENSGAPQAAIQLVSNDQDPDSEKYELADKERVLPRHGTISPWSSKATDTFGVCRLNDIVQRVECGIVYCIAFADNLAIPQFRLSEHKQLNNAESDRMAESCTNRVWRRH
ncbi:phosphoribosylformylglycinamidine synthase, partial [Coemansia sp. RSA 2610]